MGNRTARDSRFPIPDSRRHQLAFLTPGRNPFSAMSRSAIRESPKYPSTPRGRPDIEQRLRMRMGAEFRGNARSLAYAAARASGLVFGFFTIFTSSWRLVKYFAASFLRRSFLTTADV